MVRGEGLIHVERWPRAVIRHRLLLVATAHGILFSAALLAAFLLAYNFHWAVSRVEGAASWFDQLYVPLLAIAVPVKLLVFHWCRQYQGSWRYVGLRDLFGVISASLIGTFVFLTFYFVLENTWYAVAGSSLIDHWPQRMLYQSSVFALDWAATVAFVSATRVLVRFYYEDILGRNSVERAKRVLICGAGDAGEAVLREILRLRREPCECVGILDDDVPHLHGRIHDVEVVGRTSEIREIAERFEVEEVLIAMPNATPRQIRSFVERCEGTGVRFRTIPAMGDVLTGRVQVSQIRDVDIGDLLGRETVKLDVDKIGAELRDQRVLVTGAGGSIGSEMCRQIASFGPRKLILIEQAENNLFEIDRELRRVHPQLDIAPYVADIGDRNRIRAVFNAERPPIVFHAAAHKHVPMMEINPGEAIKNNVVGTIVVADAAIEANSRKMVMVSTDKAVNPTSIMGCTKRVAEMCVQCRSAQGSTQFVTVRFGNVLGSSGSVVPIFKQQIAAAGPVTVTHPEMTRYFMTITEAAQLVLQAGTMGRGGEIYVLHMGDPVRIVDMARDMITLSGLRPGIDIDIVFTGIRPGEKLFEELSIEGENIGDTAHPKIGIWKHKPADAATLAGGVARLVSLADTGSLADIQAELSRLVEEYENGRPDHADLGENPGSARAAVADVRPNAGR